MLYIDKTYKRFNKIIKKKIPRYNNLYKKLKIWKIKTITYNNNLRNKSKNY